MKCPKCDGDGVITFNKTDKNGYFNDAFFMKECSVCHGTGEVQTNEEWFATLSTKDKAWTLAEYAEEFRHCAYSWENWLKKVHKE